MASGQSQSSSGKVDWLPGQKDAAAAAIQQILMPQLFGGKPDVGQQANAARSREGLAEQLATQGLTGSGLAAKSSATLEQGLAANADAQRFQLLNRLLTAPGQQSASTGSGGGVLSCWVAEELFGVTDWRTTYARAWCSSHDNAFTRAYSRYGETWAVWVRHWWIARCVAWPIWRTLAWMGQP